MAIQQCEADGGAGSDTSIFLPDHGEVNSRWYKQWKYSPSRSFPHCLDEGLLGLGTLDSMWIIPNLQRIRRFAPSNNAGKQAFLHFVMRSFAPPGAAVLVMRDRRA